MRRPAKVKRFRRAACRARHSANRQAKPFQVAVAAGVFEAARLDVFGLEAKLKSSAGGSSSSGGSSDGNRDGERRFGYGSCGPGGDNKTAPVAKKSFRITSPAGRLPKGLPDWFLRGDADGDGQVSMAQYTTTCTEQLAAEFLKSDTDGNGIITPEECQTGAKSR
jgi:hypothetical protein